MVRVVFIHPDLGIGGAERAVIDAALALKQRGHVVQFITAHHSVDHCFEETKDGTINVTVAGDWLPRSIFGRLYAACAYMRMIYAAIYLVFFSGLHYDVIFCDQISACIPVLYMSKAKIIFYCHFPDLLLTGRAGFLKKLYRLPLDWLEEKTTGLAHRILVNSNFTASVFRDTFPSLSHLTPEVLYPIPDFAGLSQPPEAFDEGQATFDEKTFVFLSINRYERKKNIGLAIRALDKLHSQVGSLSSIHLVIAGGYDDRVVENKEHFEELQTLTKQHSLESFVSFRRSISSSEKRALLRRAQCLVYTPDREHFGIVPVEAMYLGCAVVAVNSGGPKETVSHNVTGFLCEPAPESFGEAMERLVKEKGLAQRMGEAGKDRVTKLFSFKAFGDHLERVVRELCSN